LPVKRLEHSLSVAKIAEELAIHWKEDPKKAYLSGLLHDSAKYLKVEDLKRLGIQDHQIQHQIYSQYPKLWHAFIAPVYVQHFFEVRDRSVLRAVKWHATGRSHMKKLDQILYISDYISPERKFLDRPFIKELANTNLDEATFAVATTCLLSLMKRCLKIHPYTVQCWNDYSERIDSNRAQTIQATLFQCLEKK